MARKEKDYYYSLYREALNYIRPQFDKYRELSAFYQLEQDSLPKYSDTKPWLYNLNLPFATDAVDLRIASLQANDYLGELEPLSPEDVEMVEKLSDAYHAFWNEMNMNNYINDTIPISAVLGTAYTHVVLDDKAIVGGSGRRRNGKLEPYTLDTMSVLIDPKALSLKEADYVCVTERITRASVKHDYPNFSFNEPSEKQAPEDRGEVSPEEDYNTSQDKDVFTKITFYEKIKKDGEETIEKTVLIDSVVVETAKPLSIKRFPIAQLRWKKKLKSPYGVGLMEMLLPIQKVVNEIESANANANMQYSAPSFVLREDSGIDPEELALSSGSPGTVYVADAGVNVNDVISPLFNSREIDQGLMLTRQNLEATIYKLASVTDNFLGDIGTVGNTAQGASESMQRSKTIENLFLANLEDYIEDLTGIIVEFITNAFAGDTIYTRSERTSEGTYNFQEFDVPEEATDVQYTFYIELSVKTKYSKERQKQQLLELFQIERQYQTNEIKGINFLDIIKVNEMPQTKELVQRYKHAINMDAEQRAQLITTIVTTSQELGVPPEMGNAAIVEILTNAVDTPNLDQFMQLAQQMAQQQAQMEDEVYQEESQRLEQEQLENTPIGPMM